MCSVVLGRDNSECMVMCVIPPLLSLARSVVHDDSCFEKKTGGWRAATGGTTIVNCANIHGVCTKGRETRSLLCRHWVAQLDEGQAEHVGVAGLAGLVKLFCVWCKSNLRICH